MGTKFSGLLLAPVMVVLLTLRAWSGEPWPVMGRLATTRRGKLAAAGALLAFTVVFNYAAVWAGYGSGSTPAPAGCGWTRRGSST